MDILIGVDHYWKFVDNNVIRSQHGESVCIQTEFGNIPYILLRSRLYQNLVSADIEKAFLNITISDRDRKYTKFL